MDNEKALASRTTLQQLPWPAAGGISKDGNLWRYQTEAFWKLELEANKNTVIATDTAPAVSED